VVGSSRVVCFLFYFVFQLFHINKMRNKHPVRTVVKSFQNGCKILSELL
jgi:hypothetical protein